MKTIARGRLWQLYALLVMNILVNIFTLIHDSIWYEYVTLLFTSAAVAFIEWLLISFFTKWLNLLCFVILFSTLNVLVIGQVFLEIKFRQCFGFPIVVLLANTHSDEISNFLLTYVDISVVTILLGIALTVAILAILFSQFLKRCGLRPVVLMACIGMAIYVFCFSSMKLKGEAFGITKYNILACAASCLSLIKAEKQLYGKLIESQNKIKDVQTKWFDKPNVVLVIGESSSIYHSSLYSYVKKTCPFMEEWQSKGNLFLYKDAVSITDATITAMESIYTLERHDSGVFYDLSLFPYVYKSIGYKNILMDNQYFIGEENTFMADRKLSDSMFDERNSHRYQYDGDMVKELKVENRPTLYIIHLYGQHYTYSERYPDSYSKFSANDYDKRRWSKKQRKVLAHYDNATLYFDAVLNLIIKKFQGTNTCMVFLSDHGEEVFDIDGFMGHGTAQTTKEKRYQLRVPFAIYLTEEYKEKHSNIAKMVGNSVDKKVLTDDVAQVLLELSGIRCNYSEPARSVINEQYIERPRKVLDGITFDSM